MNEYKNDNELIDEVLKYIKESDFDSHGMIHNVFTIKEGPKNNNDRARLRNKVNRILQLMKALELIDYDKAGIIKLTNHGTIIYFYGGYTKYYEENKQKQNRELELREIEVKASHNSSITAEKAYNLSRWAIGISIIAILATIIPLFLDEKTKNSITNFLSTLQDYF